jgi:lysophospholipase L1-like esterase
MSETPDNAPVVETPAEFTAFRYPLRRLADAFGRSGPVRIVAIGSSSTAGRGDVVPYPYRLEMYLRRKYEGRFPNLRIDVLNRGRSGEDATEELGRFDRDVMAEKPSLVIWQVGTNAVFHKIDKHYDLDVIAADIAAGLERLHKELPSADVLLMNPQYVTAMLREDTAEDSERMVSLIATAATLAHVNLFQRWELMRHWHLHDNVSFEQMLDPTDGKDMLHQNGWSTRLISLALCEAIATAPVMP